MPLRETVIDRAKLVEAARQARQQAYAPYSNYLVGAALLAQDGTLFTGCNVENASYSACTCAERVALVKAVSEGKREFVAVAVVTSNAAAPCGICRQTLSEFAPDLLVIVADPDRIVAEHSLADLLPDSFGPRYLK